MPDAVFNCINHPLIADQRQFNFVTGSQVTRNAAGVIPIGLPTFLKLARITRSNFLHDEKCKTKSLMVLKPASCEQRAAPHTL